MVDTCDEKVNSRLYYQTYHGHEVDFLSRVLSTLQRRHSSIIFFAGDSSLDNKYWFPGWNAAINGYETILEPPRMRPDVCYWLNQEIVDRHINSTCAINTAVEATTLASRLPGYIFDGLLEQDVLIRDSISEEDYLVVSIGGNDIALSPSLSTIANMLTIIKFASNESIASGTAFGMSHFITMFRDDVQQYVEQLVSKRKPRKVLVCMIYFPDERGEGSWADFALSKLDYNADPERLQLMIKTVFQIATSQIQISGTEVVPIPLFEVLDGKNTADYVQRVEPSPQGSQKIARLLLDRLLGS